MSILFAVTNFINTESKSQMGQASDTGFPLLKDEGWWGGIVNRGAEMPSGKNSFSFNLFGNDDGNQAAPFLISNKGRYIWSDNPFAFNFRYDSLIINKTNGPM